MTLDTTGIALAHDMNRHPEWFQHPALGDAPKEVFVVTGYGMYHKNQPLAAFTTLKKANQWMDANAAVHDEFVYGVQVISTPFNPAEDTP